MRKSLSKKGIVGGLLLIIGIVGVGFLILSNRLPKPKLSESSQENRDETIQQKSISQSEALFVWSGSVFLSYEAEREKIFYFEVNDLDEIDQIEVIINAEVTPADREKKRDGVNTLVVKVNGQLAIDGEFGYTDVIDRFLKSLSEGAPSDQRRWFEENVIKVFKRNLIYAPPPIGIGSKGERKLIYDKEVLREGRNVLSLLSLDECVQQDKDCDGFWIYSVKIVYVKKK